VFIFSLKSPMSCGNLRKALREYWNGNLKQCYFDYRMQAWQLKQILNY